MAYAEPGGRTDPTGLAPAAEERRASAPTFFARLIFGSFAWILVGMPLIDGVRLRLHPPIHASFIPLIDSAVGVALAVTPVLSLEYAIGTIRFRCRYRLHLGPQHSLVPVLPGPVPRAVFPRGYRRD